MCDTALPVHGEVGDEEGVLPLCLPFLDRARGPDELDAVPLAARSRTFGGAPGPRSSSRRSKCRSQTRRSTATAGSPAAAVGTSGAVSASKSLKPSVPI
jgi:hypothetical protein